MDVIEKIKQRGLMAYYLDNGEPMFPPDIQELKRLAKLGDALLSQKDELEHLAKEHGFYCLQGLLALMKDGDNNESESN